MKPLLPLILLISAIGLLALDSCSGIRNDYSEYQRLPGEGWRYGDTLFFTPVHTDTVCRGNFVVAIRYDGNYPYSDLWIEVGVPSAVNGSRQKHPARYRKNGTCRQLWKPRRRRNRTDLSDGRHSRSAVSQIGRTRDSEAYNAHRHPRRGQPSGPLPCS